VTKSAKVRCDLTLPVRSTERETGTSLSNSAPDWAKGKYFVRAAIPIFQSHAPFPNNMKNIVQRKTFSGSFTIR